MIRAVADRIASRARPSYRGRHRIRRPRPVLQRVFRVGAPAPAEGAAQ